MSNFRTPRECNRVHFTNFCDYYTRYGFQITVQSRTEVNLSAAQLPSPARSQPFLNLHSTNSIEFSGVCGNKHSVQRTSMGRNQYIILANCIASRFQFSSNAAIFRDRRYI